ncbi:hypothetical protein [Cellulomonas sp. P24]|uniref:hypothetical protein n=1 Tax=Cellulomonas sp. P24 TaxID=2885206 RepID=UPI00216AC5C7|nr:hypothetical protein [Cellulomonas sp. P24]MCR6494044.1 hypothetical protein [Cellulomonas sp. P24]
MSLPTTLTSAGVQREVTAARNDSSSHRDARAGDFTAAAADVFPTTRGTYTTCSPPTYWRTSTPRTSAELICSLRNSMMRTSDSGNASATKTIRMRPERRFDSTTRQNSSTSMSARRSRTSSAGSCPAPPAVRSKA